MSAQKHLVRNLILTQQQAYEGGKMFYHGLLPLTLVLFSLFHVFFFYLDDSTSNNYLSKNHRQVLQIGLELLIAWVTYFLAFRQHAICNRIETTPVFARSILEMQSLTERQFEAQSSQLQTQAMPIKKQCDLCGIKCEYRTRHCRKCRVCIQRYDHHCFWIGNCVGRHNHKNFYLFLLFQTANNLVTLLVILNLSGQRIPGAFNIFKWLMILLEIGFICFTGYLLLYHTMLIARGLTTYQHMRRQKCSYLKHLPRGYNPFSLGFVGNIRKFFTEKTRGSGFQELQIWDPLVPSFEESKKIQPGFNLIDNQYYSCC